MFTLYGFALLSSVAAFATDAEATRVNYSNCLTDFTVEHLDLKSSSNVFKKAAPSACANERSAMLAAIKKDEKQFGSSEAEATEFATEEVDGVLQSFVDGYSGYLSSSTKPVKS
ncbi:hypothetical protein [Parasphingorhabdus halotolerans]|uniref:Uncharacterized protein n=1 Tax=Parasphingorhabdus halotolerans TaxID=2725558 RepID=A0A6H2DJU9_9SPHN|nr:hypothetical protein [Parasphingorhabdus halotolerans]QJB68263.1 hypothetical protein HF685_02230 [Parasphingorhabdus halotolerans]